VIVAQGAESASPADKIGSDLETRLRESFARSREIVMQAHERAQQAVDRAAGIRAALQEQRSSVHPAQREARRRLRLLHLAVEESARSAREKDRFLATISHELRQPLNAALAALRIVELGRGDTAAAREILRRQLLQITRMVEDLVDISRMSLDRMELRLGHVDLASVLDDAVATIDPDLAPRDLTLTAVPLTSDVCIWGDESRLRQVFSNLLSNAVRYTPRGGQITISAAVERAQVAVTVSDTGRGIRKDDLARIFDPFTRGGDSQDGFGIGLSLVRTIVELHRGRTQASSPGLDCGSTFIVTLPVCPHTNGKKESDAAGQDRTP
jgi:signal transduction histidine kinase